MINGQNAIKNEVSEKKISVLIKNEPGFLSTEMLRNFILNNS